MTVISKELFYDRVGKDVSCELIHFWQANCLDANISPLWLFNLIKGTAIFFLPIYIIKLLQTSKKKDAKTLLINFIKSELRTIAYGLAMGVSLISTVCALRHIFGRLHYYNIVMIPGFVSSLSILIETEENQIIDTLIFFNALVETLLRKIPLGKLQETMLFMGVSGALMHLLENRPNEKMGVMHFWFYVPPRKMEKEKNIADVSSKNVDNLHTTLFKNFMEYFTFGYGINIIRRFLPKFGLILKKPSEILRVLFSKSNAYFGIFMGCYVTIYGLLMSVFTKNSIISKKYQGFIAGLVSGISYTISPNLQVLVIAITTSLQMIYQHICKRMKISNHSWHRLLVYIFSNGILIHNKFMYPDTCSPYYKNMIDACTNNTTKSMYENLVSKFFLM